MTEAIVAQEQTAVERSAEELAAAMLEPKGDISWESGQIERESPLFRGTVTTHSCRSTDTRRWPSGLPRTG